jgi:chorismate dehydratase
MSKSLELACVSFLNALPYVEGLRRLPLGLRPRLFLDPPFRCAERLIDREVDAALIPSIEYARIDGAVSAGGFGIASMHEVRSVLLLARRPLPEVREIAVDSNSRTSVALLRILLSRLHGTRPSLVAMPPVPGPMLERCDAALLIGDAALAADQHGVEVHDLASMWNGFAGMPFVFALWAALDEAKAVRSARMIGKALDLGLSVLPEAAEAAGRRSGLPAGEVVEYLTRNIHFILGDEERRSLEFFRNLCLEEGILLHMGNQATAKAKRSRGAARAI